MYKYSPIKTLHIKNFRNIGEATLDFGKSPIISLIGDNEAGKTSVVKSFAVAALHAYARDQKGFIRDGTGGFGVAIELEDGTLITRMKTPTLNKYTVKHANGEVYDTNKIDAGLPVEVSKVMGLLQEPETKEFIQIRTYEDQLLFVTTSASTNYKVMYDALKVDQLTRAIKLGSTESNKLKSDISNNEVSLRTLNDNLKDIQIYDLEPLINIRERLKKQRDIIKKLDIARDIVSNINKHKKQLGSLGKIAENSLHSIDLVEVSRLVSANRLIENNRGMVKLSSIASKAYTADEVDLTKETILYNLMTKNRELRDKIRNAGELVKLGGIELISEYEVQQLNRLGSLHGRLKADRIKLGVIEKDGCNLIEQSDFDVVNKLSRLGRAMANQANLEISLREVDKYIASVEDYLKQSGATVVVCDGCGEQMVLDNEEFTHSH